MADASQQMLGEFRSGPASGTALVAGVTFAHKGLLYAMAMTSDRMTEVVVVGI